MYDFIILCLKAVIIFIYQRHIVAVYINYSGILILVLVIVDVSVSARINNQQWYSRVGQLMDPLQLFCLHVTL